jgi:integrase
MSAWATRAAKERDWKAKTIADVQWKLAYVTPYIGDQALADVLPDDIDAMMDELGKALAETTTRQIRNYLYQVFESAVKRRYITYNPVIKPERRKKAKQRAPQRLSAPQTAVLLRQAEGTFYALAWWLIVCCGLRAGEMCGLRRSDIDLDNAILTVAQEYTDVRGTSTQDLPKGDKVLSIPFPRALVPFLRLHLAALTRRAAQGIQKGYWKEHQLVFPGRGGRPLNPTSLRHALTRLTDAARLPPVTTHMLRHTCGGLLILAGAPENIIGGILRHGPRNITGHYAPPPIAVMRPWVEQVYGMVAGEVRELGEQTA